jgi:serine/threonine protein kinase
MLKTATISNSENFPQIGQVLKIHPIPTSIKSNILFYNNIVIKNTNINAIKNRILPLTPKVSSGLEKEFNKNDFETLQDKCIGNGTFGSVWKVRHKTTNEIYAIKVINKENIIKQNMTEQIKKEIEIMYKLDHPHIIKLYSHFEDDEDFCLIMEYASRGQLYSFIKKQKQLNQISAKQYIKEIISAVKYLHSLEPPIVHRDIKPENILIDNNGNCKLGDFGLAKFENEENTNDNYCGTLEYLAPETLNNSSQGRSVDIWAIGVLLFEMLTGRPPFKIEKDKLDLYKDITNTKIWKINWTDDFPRLAKDLVSRILVPNPENRLSLEQILSHQWFIDTPSLRPFVNKILLIVVKRKS